MARFAAFVLPLFLASVPAHADDRIASAGKQRAARSTLVWEIGNGSHPRLGPIRFTFLKSAVTTPAGDGKVFSNIYFSCERNSTTVAIELANSTAPGDPGGLRPKAMPRLVCNRFAAAGARNLAQQDLKASWAVNEIGDVLARGLQPSQLRECVSIGVVQEVTLPKGWARDSVRVEFEITPYGRELDSILLTCGAASASAAAPAAATASAPVAAPVPAKASAPPASTEAPWKTARTLPPGRTNLRARPRLDSAVVAQLPPGVNVLVRQSDGEWWFVKSPGGAKFEGYIRQDRLVFK